MCVILSSGDSGDGASDLSVILPVLFKKPSKETSLRYPSDTTIVSRNQTSQLNGSLGRPSPVELSKRQEEALSYNTETGEPLLKLLSGNCFFIQFGGFVFSVFQGWGGK